MKALEIVTGAPRILVVYCRTSGPDANRHSILELGAAWLDQELGKEPFERGCSLRDGASWDARAAELTGYHKPEVFAPSPYLETEDEIVRELFTWSKLGADSQVVLAGSRPGSARKFLQVGSDRDPRARFLHRSMIDLHSAFSISCLARGLPVPASGFPVHRIFEALELPASSPRMPAGFAAARERDAFRKIVDLLTPVPHKQN